MSPTPNRKDEACGENSSSTFRGLTDRGANAPGPPFLDGGRRFGLGGGGAHPPPRLRRSAAKPASMAASMSPLERPLSVADFSERGLPILREAFDRRAQTREAVEPCSPASRRRCRISPSNRGPHSGFSSSLRACVILRARHPMPAQRSCAIGFAADSERQLFLPPDNQLTGIGPRLERH